jgi:hypothetical protein
MIESVALPSSVFGRAKGSPARRLIPFALLRPDVFRVADAL